MQISQFRQNHPELVVRDIMVMLEQEEPYLYRTESLKKHIRGILKNRGVNKWLRVRRLLIQLKSRWKKELEVVNLEKRITKNAMKYLYRTNRKAFGKEARKLEYLKGYTAGLQHARQQIRAICHSSREVDYPTTASKEYARYDLPEDFPVNPHHLWLKRRDDMLDKTLCDLLGEVSR